MGLVDMDVRIGWVSFFLLEVNDVPRYAALGPSHGYIAGNCWPLAMKTRPILFFDLSQ